MQKEKFILKNFTENMVGHKLGEFARPRVQGHTTKADKAASVAPAAPAGAAPRLVVMAVRYATASAYTPAEAGPVRPAPRPYVNAALACCIQGAARDMVLRSAIANAQQKDGFGGDVDRLFVSACYANQGPSQKRIRPAPMGRAFRVVKRTAHLTVAVTERPSDVVAVVGPDGEAPKRPRGAKPKAAKSRGTSGRKSTAKKPAGRKTAAGAGGGAKKKTAKA